MDVSKFLQHRWHILTSLSCLLPITIENYRRELYCVNQVYYLIWIFYLVLILVWKDNFGVFNFHQKHISVSVIKWSHTNQHFISRVLIVKIYIKTPRAHQSTFLSWPAWDTISGAKYSGVPQKLMDSSSFKVNRKRLTST